MNLTAVRESNWRDLKAVQVLMVKESPMEVSLEAENSVMLEFLLLRDPVIF